MTLQTWRTHQIRMHARYLELPILGDALYGRVPRDPTVRQAVAEHIGGGGGEGIRRHALHAELLELEHPRSGERVRWTAPLPVELRGLVEALRAEPERGA